MSLSAFLPSKSPWLNNIEPKWVHGKRAIVEPVSAYGDRVDRAHLRLLPVRLRSALNTTTLLNLH